MIVDRFGSWMDSWEPQTAAERFLHDAMFTTAVVTAAVCGLLWSLWEWVTLIVTGEECTPSHDA